MNGWFVCFQCHIRNLLSESSHVFKRSVGPAVWRSFDASILLSVGLKALWSVGNWSNGPLYCWSESTLFCCSEVPLVYWSEGPMVCWWWSGWMCKNCLLGHMLTPRRMRKILIVRDGKIHKRGQLMVNMCASLYECMFLMNEQFDE